VDELTANDVILYITDRLRDLHMPEVIDHN